MLKSAVLFITFKCGMNCPYCWERQAQKHGEFEPSPFIPWEQWLEALNRLDIETLDISGGEPLFQPGILDLISKLNSRHVAMTTNLSCDMTELVKKISPEKLFSITASYHPSSDMSLEMFTGKVMLLRECGFRLTVNFVSYPEQMYLIPQLKEHFEKRGIRFHVDPYVPTKYRPYRFSPREREFLSPFVSDDRVHVLEEKKEGVKKCSGGMTHLNIQPNGDAYRCIKDKSVGLAMVGNIFDTNFRLKSDLTDCENWSSCPGCDRDKVTIR